jgi:hypothetical protein
MKSKVVEIIEFTDPVCTLGWKGKLQIYVFGVKRFSYK